MAIAHAWHWWIKRCTPPPSTLDPALRNDAVRLIKELVRSDPLLKILAYYHAHYVKGSYVPADGGPYDNQLQNYALLSCGFRPRGGGAVRCEPVPVSVRLSHPPPDQIPRDREELRCLALDAWHEALGEWWRRRRDIEPDY